VCFAQERKDYVARTKYNPSQKRKEKNKEANMAPIKQCKNCKETKPLDEFQFRSDTKTYRNDCTSCRNDYIKSYKKTDKCRKQQNKRAQERRQTDPNFLLNQRLRARLTKVLNAKGARRQETFYTLIGCSIQEFKIYIEHQFKDEMSWELRNFELDHKIPCAFFDLTNLEEQKKCFHYTNFQPLTPQDNSKKSDIILEEHMNYLFSILF
jgi:hypothetical protein